MIRWTVWQWIAWHLPKNLIYWCFMRVVVFSTSKKYSNTGVPGLTAMDALERWGEA